MAQKKVDARLDIVEQEMAMVKEQMQKLLEIERSLEKLVPNFEKIRCSMEETQKLIQILMMAQPKMSLVEGGGSSPMMDNSARRVERSLPPMEEMQKMVAALEAPRDASTRMAAGDKAMSIRTEVSSRPKERTPEQAEALEAGRGIEK